MDFYYHLLSCSSKDLICCLICLIFLKSSWWPVLTFSSQTRLSFQMNLLKVKIRKEHKKIICGFKNTSWTINICLKKFHDPCRNLPAPSFIRYGLLLCYSVFHCRVESIKIEVGWIIQISWTGEFVFRVISYEY